MNEKLTKYYASAAIGLVLVFAVALSAGLFSVEGAKDVVRILSDAFFVPGVLLSGAAGLSFAASKGFYDVFSYGIQTIKSHFEFKKDKRAESLYEFKERKNSEKRGWLKETLVVGLSCIALAAVLVVVYILL